MIYLFHNAYPAGKGLLTQALTQEYADTLIKSTSVVVDGAFDSSDVIDVVTLDAAHKVRNTLEKKDKQVKVAITRNFPHPSREWNMVIETQNKMSGMSSFVGSYMLYSRHECQEILCFQRNNPQIKPIIKDE